MISGMNAQESAKKQFVKEVLYKDVSYLQDRLAVFNYMTNPEHIWDWVWRKDPITHACSILEVGSGLGTYWQRHIAQLPQGCAVTLTDISPAMLTECKKCLAPYANFTSAYQVADVEHLPFADNTFDKVFSHFVLCYTDCPERALQELKE